MTTPVLATKISAPISRPKVVSRPGLLAQLDATWQAGRRLTVVSAPAGFGKTTLLSDWCNSVARRRPSTGLGWLSLDAGDNDSARFLTHLAAALDAVGLHVGPAVLAAAPTASLLTTMTALVSDLAAAAARSPERAWALVLDDYHAIESQEVHDAVTFLLEHRPEVVHLLVATRSDPPLPLARLRSRGQLVEVRAADLRFTAAQAQEFLNEVMGLDLTTSDVAALEARTEGWIAGLQLAALSLHGIGERREVGEFIGAFTGSHRFVIDYLADEVLSRQSAEVRDFLLRTAVLDRLTGPLCDAVTDRAGGNGMLADLERANLFVVPLDNERSWYRYHHLFADVLQARMLAEHPDQVLVLHRRASDWYASRDLVADAVRHALAAKDFARAAYLIEQAMPAQRRARQDSVLLGWVRALPDSAVRRSPVLSIASAWSLMMAGDVDGLASRLDDAETALSAGAEDDTVRATWADTEDLRTAPATICVYRAALAQARGDVEGTVRHARRALEQAGPTDHFVRGASGGYLGLAAWAAGNVREALSTFGDAVRSLHAAGNLVDELDSTVVLADMWVAAGRPGRARRLYERALRTATAPGEPYPRATADLHVGLAELDAERDDVGGAEAHLATAHALAERESITENRHRRYQVMAQLRVSAGDFATARDLLDQAEALYRRGFYPEVRPIAAIRARLDIAAGDLVSAAEWADQAGVTVDDDPDYLHEYEHLTLARLLLAQTPAGSPLAMLDRLRAAAADAGRAGSLLEISVVQALAHQAAGDVPRAADTLIQAMSEAPEPEGYVQLFQDEGAPMVALLRATASASRAGAQVREHLDTLLARAGTPAPALHRLAEPLSPRELQVLRLLHSELTGPQVARELYVTVNTLRTHTKRIFTKLDVTTRAAAVRRAQQLGLL